MTRIGVDVEVFEVLSMTTVVPKFMIPRSSPHARPWVP
jgi:hypothetical protein